ncbi:helix-turn-helix transcriptional regulator [Streptomyces noursei]|uniref:helix-turn-helix domain-containing protein n=1 Tax=Streptomyces noursei TaxID=1971 RepID=UPI0030F1696E
MLRWISQQGSHFVGQYVGQKRLRERPVRNEEGIEELLRRLRSESGETQAEIAKRCGEIEVTCTKSAQDISRYENGKRMPTPFTRSVLAQVFGVDVALLDSATRVSRARRRAARRVDSRHTVDSDDPLFVGDADRREDDPVRRRKFMGAAAVGAGIAAEPWGRLAHALSGRGRADSTTSQVMAERSAYFFEAETLMPASKLYERLVGHVDTLSWLISSSTRQGRALTATAGEAAALAGWVAYDLGNTEHAAHFYGVARDAAKEAEQQPVTALVMAYESYAMDDPRQAAELLAAAQYHVRGKGCATARAWIAAREAEERASAGDYDGALRAIDRAHAVFDYAQPEAEQPWVRFFSRARLDSMTVATYARMNHPELAEVSRAALDALTPEDAKVRAVILGDVATAYVLQGQIERGVEVARLALKVTQRAEATLGRQRLVALAAQLPAGNNTARQLHDEIRVSLA